ncbi:hypothetical protein [Granulicella arctica]|uniref:hypothetical protein n=1 Tax=Granulicella arctica TaxID=940613 RepID=UPI0021E0DBFA|nr:hypothetical protein [Granulicella arctica]
MTRLARALPLILLALSYSTVSQQIADPNPDLWQSPDLGLGSGKTIGAALLEPFEDTYEVTVREPGKLSPATLHNCKEYLRVEDAIYDAGPAPASNSLNYVAARCNALHLLQSARPAVHPTFRDFDFRHLAVRNLPPGLALIIADEEQKNADRITRHGGSILDLEKDVSVRATRRDEADLATPEWTATLTVLARADFLNDGREELLIRRNAAAIGGTYRSTRIFLLSRKSSSESLKIERALP